MTKTANLNRPLISVVVPHLNQADALAACLSSLQDQALDYSLYEIIVVDNGSTHPPHDIVASSPNVRLVVEEQPGPGPARNAGIREAQADYVAFLDADCRAHPAWLSTALHVLTTSPKKTILGGDVQIWHPVRGQFTDIEAYESVFAYRSKLYVERHGFCPTGNLAAPRSAFKTVGMFRGIQFAEDMEWGDRARRAGFQLCYVAGMIVFHPARSSIRDLYAKWDRQSQHYFNMIKGRPAWRTRWILRALMVAASPAVDFVKVLASDRVQGSAARAKAIVVLVKVRFHRARTMISLLRSNEPIRWNREPVQQAGPPVA